MKKFVFERLWQVVVLFFVLVLSSCTTTKSISQTPAGEISYKIITQSTFQYLDAAYGDVHDEVIRKAQIGKEEIIFPLGKVYHGFISSISCTGYGAKNGNGSIELQILLNGLVVEHQTIEGKNPSLAISYRIE